MSERYFIWRGVSSLAHGMVVTKMPPPVFPAKRDESIPVPGKSGALHRQDGAWEEMLLSMECYLPYEQGGAVSNLVTLANWLSGTGWLELSDRPGRRYYARLTDSVSLAPLMEGFSDRIFALSFWADPFAYESTPTVYTETAPFTLENPGSANAEPLIELTATGDITITIGDKTLDIAGAPGHVMIDVAGGFVYDGTVNLSGSVNTDDWPLTIPLGSTAVSWTGNITEFKIQPNWRWL